MPESFEEAYIGILEAVQSGKITEERINESLRRIYRVKYAAQAE
jgi:beta-N-acetylhexosaminidase